jgi:hypothetical protein
MLNGSTTTWQLFRQDIVKYEGRRMVIPLRTTRNASPQFMARSAHTGPGLGDIGTAGSGPITLSTPGYQGVQTAFADPRFFTASIEVPQDALEMTKTDKGAFYNLLDFEMMGLMRDSKEKLDRSCYGDGSGKIPFYLDYDGAGNEVPSVVAQVGGATAGGLRVAAGHHFFVGQRVRAYDHLYAADLTAAGLFPNLGYAVVTSVVRNNGGTADIVLADSHIPGTAGPNISAWEAGDIGSDTTHLHDLGSCASTPVAAAPAGLSAFRGLAAMVSTGNPLGESTYLQINRSEGANDFFRCEADVTAHNWTSATANPYWTIQTMIDNIHDNSLGEIDLLLMTRPLSRAIASFAAGSSAGGAVSTAWPPYGKQQFTNTLKTWVGFQSKDQDKHPGKSDWMLFNGTIPMVVDKYADKWGNAADTAEYGCIWCLDTSSIYLGMVTDFSWWDVGGIFQPVPGAQGGNYQFAVIANMYMMGDFVCDAPNRNGIITNIKIV